MNIIRKYIDYLSDNPEKYWFKRKLYGWGWTPVTWQGWLIILVFAGIIIKISLMLPQNPTNEQLVWFFGALIVSVAALIGICYKTGEKPKWQWGTPKK